MPDTPIEPPPLRVGLLLPGLSVPAWVARMVEQIQHEGHAQIVLLVIDATPQDPTGWRWTRAGEDSQGLASRIIGALLRRALRFFTEHRPRLPDAFEEVDLQASLLGVPSLAVLPQRTRWSDRLADTDLQAIATHAPDVLIRVGFRILRGGILNVARHGVWSFHHGDNAVNRGGPPGWWEAMQSWPTTGSTLQMLSEDLDNGLVLERSWSPTDDASVADNNRQNYAKSLSMMPRQLARLHQQGPEAFFDAARQRQAQPQIYSERLFRHASNRELLVLLVRRSWDRLRKICQALTHYEQWILLVQPGASLAMSLWRFQRLQPPCDHFWADPFLLEHQGRTWLYFEDLPFSTGLGHIAVGELLADGRLVDVQPALQEPHHLSYPFVFEHEGEVYMIPESRASQRITLYRCTEMPARWEKVMDLMLGVQAVDSTLLRHDGRWWLFTNLVSNPGASSNDELFVFHASDFRTQQWTPHPLNPIVSDVRRARGAGRFFEHDGQWYRPAQDCGQGYGWGFSLNRIEQLDDSRYAESTVTSAMPNWAPDVLATHSFARSSRFTVIDARIRQRGSWRSARRQLNRWLGRR